MVGPGVAVRVNRRRVEALFRADERIPLIGPHASRRVAACGRCVRRRARRTSDERRRIAHLDFVRVAAACQELVRQQIRQ